MNKKGLIPVIVVLLGIALVILLLVAFFSSKFRWMMIGIGLLVLGFFALKYIQDSRIKATIFIILLGTGLIIIFSSGILQTAFSTCPSGEKYCSTISPNARYECNLDTGAKKYPCGSNEHCENGECVKDEVCGSGERYCSDIDPNARYECNLRTGIATRHTCSVGSLCLNGECVINPANCPSGERYCSDIDPYARFECNLRTGEPKKYYCTGNKICENGECVTPPNPCPSGERYCSGESPTHRYVCKPNTGAKKYPCGSNEHCENGECVKDEVCGSGERYCSDIDPNARYECNLRTGIASRHPCKINEVCENGECVESLICIVDEDCEFYERCVDITTVEKGFLNWREWMPFVEPKVETKRQCVIAEWVLWSVIGGIILVLGVVTIIMWSPKKRKK